MNPEVLGLAKAGRNRAELDVEILDALRNGGPQTVSQLYRLNGNRTRKQLTESLSRLVRLHLVGQESRTGCGNTEEIPYYIMPKPEPTPEQTTPALEQPVEDSSGN
jgi:hypothetical protein